MFNMVDEVSTMKYGECKDGHLHAIRSQFLFSLVNAPHEPMSYMFHTEFTSKDRVFVSDTLKISLFECPMNIAYMKSPAISSPSSLADDDSLRGTANFFEETLLPALKFQHEQMLNNFKLETDKIIESFNQRFASLHCEMNKITEKVNSCKEEVDRLRDEIQKQSQPPAPALPAKKYDSEEEESDPFGSSETLNAEIRAIKRDRRKTFIDYLKPVRGFPKPIIFPININGYSVMAAHDPRVPYSIISSDLLKREDFWEEINEHLFLIPWRRRKLQSIDQCGYITIKINGRAMSLEVFISSYWSRRKVLLGANFNKTYVDSIDEMKMRMRLYDDNNALSHKSSFETGFEWFESARKDHYDY